MEEEVKTNLAQNEASSLILSGSQDGDVEFAPESEEEEEEESEEGKRSIHLHNNLRHALQ